VSGIEIAFPLLTASDQRQHHIEHKICEKMRRDVGQEVAKFHVKYGEYSAQHECRNDTADSCR